MASTEARAAAWAEARGRGWHPGPWHLRWLGQRIRARPRLGVQPRPRMKGPCRGLRREGLELVPGAGSGDRARRRPRAGGLGRGWGLGRRRGLELAPEAAAHSRAVELGSGARALAED